MPRLEKIEIERMCIYPPKDMAAQLADLAKKYDRSISKQVVVMLREQLRQEAQEKAVVSAI